MAKISSLLSCINVILCIYMLVVSSSACDNGTTTKVQGMFIFGGDIVDNGNNNGIVGKHIKSNYLPYGVDFPDGPTGRFSNGKTIVDCVADNLKLPYPPPYPDFFHKGTPLVGGINFGSTGTGIFTVTGSGLVGVKHMDEQISKFKNNILQKLKQMLRCSGQIILPQYLFVIGTGNNDYSSYYILKQYLVLSPEVFAAKLVKRYFEYVQKLYDLGARKFLLISTYPIGCEPGLVKEKTSCIQFLNDATDMFHDELLSMIKHSKQDMPDAQFSVLNSGKIITDIVISNGAAAGLTNVNCTCCETNAGDTCKKAGNICTNRKEYLYYDGLHLTEAANCYLGGKAFNSADTSEVFPVNLQNLVTSTN